MGGQACTTWWLAVRCAVVAAVVAGQTWVGCIVIVVATPAYACVSYQHCMHQWVAWCALAAYYFTCATFIITCQTCTATCIVPIATNARIVCGQWVGGWAGGAVGGSGGAGQTGGVARVAQLEWLVHGGETGTCVVGVVARGGAGVAGGGGRWEASGAGVVARLTDSVRGVVEVGGLAETVVGEESAMCSGGVAGETVGGGDGAGETGVVADCAGGGSVVVVASETRTCGIEQ